MIFWTNNCLLFAGILTSELFAATLCGCLSSCLFTLCGQHPYTADENVGSCIFHGNTIRCFSTVADSMGSQPAGGPQIYDQVKTLITFSGDSSFYGILQSSLH